MGLFDNFSGSPLTVSNPQFSAVQKPDFGISLDIGKFSGFGQGLFPQPTFGETKPQTQAEWARQQFSNIWDQKTQNFHNNLQDINSLPEKKFDATFNNAIPDYAQQFQNTVTPSLNGAKLQAGMALQNSSDSGTKLLGRMQADEAMGEITKPLDFASGNKQSLSEKFLNSQVGQNSQAISQGIDTVGNIASMFNRGQSTFNGPKGDVRAGIEAGWNGIADAAANFGPYGKMVSMGMKAVSAVNGIQGAIFGATDGMTTTDAIMDSPLGVLTGVGWVNQAFGKNAETITKDSELFAEAGSSYGGTSAAVDSALEKSGKKYGAFSTNARHKANDEIREAKRQQNVMSDIVDQAADRFAIRNSMSAINSNRRAFAMRGGYDQAAVRAGRHGLSLKNIMTAKRVVSALKFQQGGKTKDPFDFYLSTLPAAQRDSTDFRVRDYWEFNGRPKDFDEAISKGMFTQHKDGWHAKSVAENPKTGEIEYMKSSNHPTRYMESDWYEKGLVYDEDENGNIISTKLSPGVDGYDDWLNFTKNYELQKTEPYWKYVKRKPQGEAVGSYQEGGILEISLSDIPEEYLEPVSTIEEVTLDSILPEFKEGGKVNVIPEGALHARLHHMENAENLTKKGIPVVSEKENGQLEQQAEIERDEIIFRLEVTKKLEELLKKYSDNETSQKDKDLVAIEAGKLLVEEILNNTQDNTNLINNIN